MNKILVLCDDVWHPAEVIQKGIAGMAGEGYEFDVVMDAKDILTPEMLERYPVVISCKSNNITAANPEPWFEEGVTEAGPRQLREYVENGGCFIAVHSALAFSRKFSNKDERFLKPNREYIDLVGCSFLGHPPRCTVGVHVTNPKHPIMKGVDDFTVRDEHYQLCMETEDVDFLFETVSESGGVQVGGYTRKMGKGKICVMTPGHNLSVWENENFRKMLLNAIRFGLEEQA